MSASTTHTLVRYRVRNGRAAENEAAIRAVFAALERDAPPGLSYGAFLHDDGVTFVHLVSAETPEHAEALTSLPAFEAFTAGVRDRCDAPPAVQRLSRVGLYASHPGTATGSHPQ